jgi:Domain of unknown function (DUF5753)/Helix-turn-helix domain
MISADPADGTPIRNMSAPYAGGPTVLRMVLGAQMRKLRQASDIPVETAAHTIRASASKISRLERGRVSCKERDIVDLLTLYGVHDEQERGVFLELAREAATPGWWHHYADALPSWLESYVGLEEAASRIRTYEIQFVPGLLQTESYARAVMRRGHPGSAAQEIDWQIAVRMRRQAILSRPTAAPQYWAVVHEEALRRPLGSRQLMRSQIEHLMEVTQLPNVTIRVVSARPESMVGEGSPFTILRFSEPELPDVVYLEHLTSAIYLDKRSDLDCYLAAMNRLLLEAGPLVSTMTTLSAIHSDI